MLTATTFGLATTHSFITSRSQATKLTTSSGRPAFWAISASASTASGVDDGALTIAALPMMSAGAIFWKVSSIGKLKGITQAITPSGSRLVNTMSPSIPGLFSVSTSP